MGPRYPTILWAVPNNSETHIFIIHGFMRLSKYLLVLLMSLLAISVMAQPRGHRGPRPPRHRNEQRPPVEKVDSAFAAKFKAQSQNLRGLDMKYRVAAIGEVKSEQPIVVVYLHGHSASGNDNLKPLAKKGVRSIYDYLEKNNIAAYLLVPQCPENRRWNERESNGWQMTNVVKEIIDEFVKTHGNPNRVYIFGESMGGAGVFRMLNDYSNYFTAAMIAASVPRSVSAGKISKTPLCYVVGSEDDVVICDETMKMIKELQKKKANMRYELMQGKTHPETCRDAFTEENIEWVLGHTNQ
jgi:predicted peptidase